MIGHRSRLGHAARYVFLVIFALIFLGPFAIQIANSFKTDAAATSDTLSLIPHPGSLAAWKEIFGVSTAGVTDFPRWLTNSLFVSVCLTVANVVLDSMAGYALARLHFRGRRIIFGFIVATLAVPNVALLIPQFLVLRELRLFNTYQGMILPLTVGAASIYMMRQFFLQVPEALEEAARLDGASVWTTYWRVVLPVVKPGLITLTILSFQASWNQFSFFLVATISPKYYTLTTGLANVVNGGLSAGNQYPLKLGAALLTTLPIGVLFFFFQRQLTRSRIEGAVK